jgi:hypothetical protein
MRLGKGMSADAHNLTLGMSIPWVARLIHVSLYFVFCQRSYSSDPSDESGYGDGSDRLLFMEDVVASIDPRDELRAGTLRVE